VLLHVGSLNGVKRANPGAPIRDPKWQAHTFASAILMPESMVCSMQNLEEVVCEFKVSEAAARRLSILNKEYPFSRSAMSSSAHCDGRW
jgi:hypothetical protein